MRILYLGRNDERRCASTTWYLKNQLAQIESVEFLGPGYPGFPLLRRWDISKTVSRVYGPDCFDVIVIDHYWDVSRKWKNLDKIEIPKAFIISDPHHEQTGKIEYINKNEIDLSLFVVKHSIMRFKNKMNCSIRWLPWSVDIRVFRDYGFERDYDVTFLGTVGRYYPLRKKILNTLKKTPDIKFFTAQRPSGWNLDPKIHLFKENYSKVLAKSKIFIFGTSILNYPLAKFFEGMACNTLVMAPMPYDSQELHFEPGLNFVEISEENFLERIRYYLEHETERCEIARQGLNTVRKYHTVEIRAKQLVDYLKCC